ncbi:MAG TPA: glucoamylase family protein, partial [Chthoniobacterales bacterium]
KLGQQLWGKYGFANAFNIDHGWYDPHVIGIDLGMVLLAIENCQTGIVWDLTNRHYATPQALRAAGFRVTTEPEPRLLQNSEIIGHRVVSNDVNPKA